MLGAVVLASALSLALACGPALAQTSQKPIQIIVPFAPGASADGAARIVANELGPRLGRQVAVENKAGAGGTLGLQQVAKSIPDGDTLGVGATGALLLNPNLPSNPGPDLLRELAPVAKLIDVAIVLVANPATGPKTIRDMIERSKTTPGGLAYGSTGTNTSQHLSVELLKQATGANLVHVPYRGSAPTVVDLLAGQIPLASVDLTSAYPHIQSGRLIALGLADSKRFPVTPEIPTIAEGGVPGFGRASGFIGLFAPAGTPAPVVKKLSQEVAAILATPGAQTTARALTSATAYEDDETFARFLTAESTKWKQALSSLNLSN
jgi:tripartite-type tricarboxylate transporter receptor subunit TctC